YQRARGASLYTTARRVDSTVASGIPLLLRLSFLVFVFTIPIESLNLTLNFGPVSLARMAGLGFFAVSVIYVKRCYSFVPSPVWLFLCYLTIFIVLSLTTPMERSDLATRVYTWVQLIAFFWIASNLLQDVAFSRTVMRTYAFAAIALIVASKLGLPGFSAEVMGGSAGERVTTIGANPNYLGLVLAVAAVILLGLALQKGFRAGLELALMLPLLVMIVQTGSRAGIVGLMAGSLCYLSQAS